MSNGPDFRETVESYRQPTARDAALSRTYQRLKALLDKTGTAMRAQAERLHGPNPKAVRSNERVARVEASVEGIVGPLSYELDQLIAELTGKQPDKPADGEPHAKHEFVAAS